MSVEFTTPKKKNLDLSFRSSADVLTTLTSSLERGVTTLEVNKPQGFTLSSPNNAIELDDILINAEISFQADGQGFTNGGSISTWTNNGTTGSNHNAVSGGDASRDPIYDTDDASNPFINTGAVYFRNSIDQTPTDSMFLNLTNRYSASGDLTIYVAFAYEDGINPAKPPPIAEVFIDSSNADDFFVGDNDESYTGSALDFSTPDSASNSGTTWVDGGINRLTITDKTDALGGASLTSAGRLLGQREVDLKLIPLNSTGSFTGSVGRVFVIRKLATSGNVFVYDHFGSQVGFIAGGTDDLEDDNQLLDQYNPISFNYDIDGFGRQKKYLGSFYFGISISPKANYADDKGVYVAAIGAFNKDIGDRESKALGRLLGEKYLP